MWKKLLLALFLFSILAAVVVGLAALWGYHYITRDLPQLTTIEDYRPPAVSQVFARDGTLVGEYFGDERRYPAKLKEVPMVVRNAFLAAEDASFYEHKGIDPLSIARAFVTNLREGHAKQGGSTITQQVVKNMLLTPEKKLRRKLLEAILSYQIEKRFTKDEILEIYLNQIFFGNNAYGIKAAARFYFHKELGDLNLAEAATLAGLPKAPSKFSPILHPDLSRRRQRYVLHQMVKHGFISRDEADEALRQRVEVFAATPQNIFYAPWYVSEVRRVIGERWRDLNLDADGLQIHTALDVTADALALTSLQKGLRDVDKRRGWRGPLERIAPTRQAFLAKYPSATHGSMQTGVVYPALVMEISQGQGTARVELGFAAGTVNLRSAGWAKKHLADDDSVSFVIPEQTLRPGDVIEVSYEEREVAQKGKKEKQPASPAQTELVLILDQTPQIEGALTLVDPYTGEVRAIAGGYSYQKSQFNRATQSYRQPGSSFKPIVYLSAVDGFNYTPATIVYDTPRTFRVGDQFWTPANFDEKFLGAITLRVALEKSRNLVSADIVSRIGVDPIIQYAKKLGIESKIGRNLSIALGSSEVTLLELVRAYGVFAAHGVLVDSAFVLKIVDRNGKVIYDRAQERLSSARQVINENSAFIMANMMKGVIEHGTGYKVKELGRPVAGKTGTSNEEMDTWFIGYTPHWVAGVWVGFDQKKRIGEKETGGRVAAPIWLHFMQDFLKVREAEAYQRLEEEAKAEAERLGIEYQAPEPIGQLDFSVPEGVDPFWVNKETGTLSSEGEPGAILEYFVKGTEPEKPSDEEKSSSSYLESPEF